VLQEKKVFIKAKQGQGENHLGGEKKKKKGVKNDP